MVRPPLRYHVLHETRYDYGSSVSLSQQHLHLAPRALAWQQVEEQRIDIDPAPAWRRDGHDAFGNPVTWIAFDAPHDTLRIRSAMTIAVTPYRPGQIEKSPPWESVRARLAYAAAPPRPEDLDALRFLFESAHVRIKRELADYAAGCFPPGTPVLAGAQALMARIFREVKFDPEATTVSTPVMEVLEKKRGVCQDFAHLMLSCLRSQGLAARYVSGYLLTQPPPGVALAVATRLDAIARSQGNLQLDDFIPDRVGTLVIRNSQQFPEAAARILWLRFVADRLCRRLYRGQGLGGRRLGGLFFTHWCIIARITCLGSIAGQLGNANVGFSHGG